jgi:Cu+-exporting ATPase
MQHEHTSDAHDSTPEIDPVCGMTVDPTSAAGTTDYQGKRYYFCSSHCLHKFEASPGKYLKESPQKSPNPSSGRYSCPMHPEVIQDHPGTCPKCGMALEPVFGSAPSAKVEYTCPMHPQIVRDQPGNCPICGMPLEPRAVTPEEGPNPELVNMSRRFWAGAILTLPIFLLAMADMLPGRPLHVFNMQVINWIQLVLATPVVLWCGWPFFERAWASILNRSPNMFTLIALGVGAAYLYSVVATIAPWLFPAGFQSAHEAVEPYFDTAAVVTVLVLLGQVLEIRARTHTSSAIKKLLGLAPKAARLVRADGKEDDIQIGHVHQGDMLRIRPGEKVPVDAIITQGRTAVDESMISGEPNPVEKGPGSKVIGGTVNGTGSLLVRAEKVGSDTLLAQIVRMVTEAQRGRAPIERLVNHVAGYFVPAVLVTAVLTFIIWALWGVEPKLAHALVNSVSVLIIACPCALGLATPMAIMVGTGRAAETGVLFRDAEALEQLEKADIAVVDKTGTLTEGKPRLIAVETLPGADFSSDELLRLAGSLERGSEHPLAAAIAKGAEERRLALIEAKDFQSRTGKGVTGRVQNRSVALGNAALAAELSIDLEPLRSRADALRADGQTVMFVAVDGKLAGLLGVADPIRSSTPEAIRQLHEDGLRVIMLTGDNQMTAEAVARKLGIDEVQAEVLPEKKHEVVKRLQREGHIVAMAGDGINDAPALAQANVGIAMGTGTDVAMESAGVTLVQGDLQGIAKARRLSHMTMKNIRQNLFLAFIYNAASVPVAAGLLYPFCGLLISPIWASAAMSLSSLSVVGNALRLRKTRL